MAWMNITKKIDLNVDSTEFMDSPKKLTVKIIKNSSKSYRSRRIEAVKIIHMNNMAHEKEEENCRPREQGLILPGEA
jgi:hypothetical protein